MEYLVRDEMIVAHVAGGIDAFIKVSQGWPVSSSPLNLTSLKSSDQHSKGVSLSFLCKVKVRFYFCLFSFSILVLPLKQVCFPIIHSSVYYLIVFS